MPARIFMETKPVTLHPSDTIRDAAQSLMEHRYRTLPVVDDDGRFLGIISVNCLLHLVLPKAATMRRGLETMPYVTTSLDKLRNELKKVIDQPVTICLGEEVKVVHPDTSTVETLLTLYKTRKSLPVVDKETGRLEGVISYFDVGSKIMEEDF